MTPTEANALALAANATQAWERLSTEVGALRRDAAEVPALRLRVVELERALARAEAEIILLRSPDGTQTPGDA